MWSAEFSIETKARPEAVWNLWRDTANWSRWDHGITSCELSGPFAVGTRGVLKPKGGPSVKFEILKAEGPYRFSDRSYLPLTHLDLHHEIRTDGDKTIVTHRVEISGLLAPLFSRLIGKDIAKDFPETVTRLVRLAEEAG